MIDQLIGMRAEVRGARVWWGKSALRTLPILDVRALDEESRSFLLRVFAEVSSLAFPSLLEQLTGNFPGRIRIDLALSEILSIREYQSANALKKLYVDVAQKLQSLKTMMTRD